VESAEFQSNINFDCGLYFLIFTWSKNLICHGIMGYGNCQICESISEWEEKGW